MKFVCKRDCQFKSHIFKRGEVIDVNTIIKCPACEGKGCEKCRMTGRISPPHHFEEMKAPEPVKYVDAEKPVVQPDEEVSDESVAIEAIRSEFEKRGIAFDRRWGLKKLQDELKKATKEGK